MFDWLKHYFGLWQISSALSRYGLNPVAVRLAHLPVIPVKTGIHVARHELGALDTGVRRYDDVDYGLTSCNLQEILQQLVAVFGGDAFGVKLHSVELVLSMAQTHDDAVIAGGGDLKTVGKAVTLHGE